MCFNCKFFFSVDSLMVFWGEKLLKDAAVADGLSLTLCVGLLVQVGDEFAPHLLVSSQSEGVGQQGGGVQVVQLAGNCFLEAAQGILHHRVLLDHRQTQT